MLRFALLLLFAVPCLAQQSPSETPDLRLNHIQVLGSHNSYKAPIDSSLMEVLMQQDSASMATLDYAHPPLTEQLDLGLRKLELDVVYDPEGGRYADPFGIRLVNQLGLPPGPPYDPDGEMQTPGFKVLHVQDIDFRSTCLTFIGCLEDVKTWSDAHPEHLPVVISLNAKTDVIDRPSFVEPLPFDSIAFAELDEEILSVFPPERLLRPDDVRGEYETLEAAVLDGNWPTLAEARGRMLFVLDEGGEKQATYIDGHPALRGRVMFVNADPGTPEAAFLIINDPVGDSDHIKQMVEAGYLVRTRADANTIEARTGDTTRREAAFSSGAHFISTDYYRADPRFESGFEVQLPGGGVARCNPVHHPTSCEAALFEKE